MTEKTAAADYLADAILSAAYGPNPSRADVSREDASAIARAILGHPALTVFSVPESVGQRSTYVYDDSEPRKRGEWRRERIAQEAGR